MLTSCNLDKDQNGNPVEERKYQGMICSLLYLTTSCSESCLLCLFMLVFKHPYKNHIWVPKNKLGDISLVHKKGVCGTPKEWIVTSLSTPILILLGTYWIGKISTICVSYLGLACLIVIGKLASVLISKWSNFRKP